MKATVTISIEEYDNLRKCLADAEKFRNMRAEIQSYVIYPEVSPQTRVMDVRKPYLNASQIDFTSFLERYLL